jgi:thiol-disulfide isomerase/thioredoxin
MVVPDFSIKSVDGRKFELSDAVKHGPVMVDFWAIGCGPCRAELPEYEKAYRQYGPKGVQFVTINGNDRSEDIKEFAKYAGLTMPMLFDGDGAVSTAYGISSIPVTLVIDKHRKCVAASIGYAVGAIEHDLPATLDALLAEKT